MGLSPFASTSGDHGVVGRILDVGGHNESFVGPVPLVGTIEGVPDIDAVVEGVARVVGNES